MKAPSPRVVALILCALCSISRAQTAPRASGFVRGDVDGDGFSDIVEIQGGEVQLYRGGASRVIEEGALRSLVAATAGREIARVLSFDAIEDLDGDRRADTATVVLETRAGSSDAWVRTVVHSSTTQARTLVDHSTPMPPGDVMDAALGARSAGDVDGDGHADMIAGPLLVLAQPVRVIDVSTLVPWRGALGVWALGDSDHDGRAELWAAPIRHHGAPPFHPATGVTGGSGVSFEWTQRTLRARPRPLFATITGPDHLVDVRAADVTGDRGLELFATSVRPAMAIDARVSGAATLWMMASNAAPIRLTSVQARQPTPRGDLVMCIDDLDGDARADLVTRGTASIGATSEVRRWSFRGRAPRATITTIRPGSYQVECGRDINGDGRGDLVAFGAMRASLTSVPFVVSW